MQNLVFFLRKTRIFNKSRYSRNRQTARVAFYLAIFVNILVIFSVFAVYYKILFKLALLWWPFFIFLFSFVFGAYLRTTSTSNFKNILNFLKNIKI